MNKAGGKNTTINGKIFENLTSNDSDYEKITTKVGSVKLEYYKKDNIILLRQSNFRKYIKKIYNIDIFRNPDEAYIIPTINNLINIIIIEKKYQQTEGSVETKLWSGPSLKREYEIVLGNNFKIDYCFVLNSYLHIKLKSNNQKYIILKQILEENNITILFGEDINYFLQLNSMLTAVSSVNKNDY